MSTALAAPATSPATAPAMQDPTFKQLLVALACVGIGTVGATLAAWFLGAWRRNIQGPTRIQPGAPVWPMFLALVAIFLGLFAGGTGAYLAFSVVDGPGFLDEIARPPSAPDFDPAAAVQLIVRQMQISAIAYLGGTLAALIVVLTARQLGWRGGLALALRGLPRGVLWGLLALLLVIPWMMTASVLFRLILQALDVEVEALHELIRAIRDHPEAPLIAWALASAIVVAPLAEEILFRGVLQTALVHGWAWLIDPKDGGRAFEVIVAPEVPPPASVTQSVPAPLAIEYQHPARPAPPTRYPPSALARWLGIILTSMVFAALHELWSMPLIFILSLALGYLYERTGNLWTSITVHFGFNAFNMLLVLPFLLS